MAMTNAEIIDAMVDIKKTKLVKALTSKINRATRDELGAICFKEDLTINHNGVAAVLTALLTGQGESALPSAVDDHIRDQVLASLRDKLEEIAEQEGIDVTQQ